jgi:hypothetical protein
MNEIPIDKSAARRMLEIGTGARASWGSDELKVAWDYLLQSRLTSIVRGNVGREVGRWADLPIREVVHGSERQPVEALRALKEAAQELMSDADRHEGDTGPIPAQAASVLYHLAIVLALTWHGVAISSMDEEKLKEGVGWSSRQKWVDPASLAVFARWLIAAGC